MKAIETLEAADFLVEFVNLRPEDAVMLRTKIRDRGSDFIPDAWWDYRDGRQWVLNQKWLREAWDAKFELFLFDQLRLITSVFDPQNLVDVMLGIKKRPTFADMGELAEEYGYHKAVRYLIEQPWRAKMCEECGSRFIANHNKRRYCSLADENGFKCSKKAILQTKREYWEANKNRLRPINRQKE